MPIAPPQAPPSPPPPQPNPQPGADLAGLQGQAGVHLRGALHTAPAPRSAEGAAGPRRERPEGAGLGTRPAPQIDALVPRHVGASRGGLDS